jgi:hypothetical protein
MKQKIMAYDLDKCGPNLFFRRAKNSFFVGSKDQENPPGTVSEN